MKSYKVLLALLAGLLFASDGHAQQSQCRTVPAGTSTSYCASEATVAQSLGVLPSGPFASVAACSSSTEGQIADVTDSTTNLFGSTITGGGSFHVLAYCNGTNWTVAGGGVAPTSASFTASLGADVNLTNTSNYFDGPSVAQGSVGTWFVSASVTVVDTGGAAGFLAKLWDGSTVIASGVVTTAAANFAGILSLSGIITSPAGNLKISVRDSSATTGKIGFNQSGNGKDSTISAFRLK